MQLLLADDHHLVRDALATFIERHEPGACIVTADSLDGALAAAGAADGRIDVVVLDFRMPGMDGLSGLVQFRKRFPDTPVVVMSGVASEDDVRAMLRLGARGFLPKTLKAAAFVNALKVVLAGEVFLPYGKLPIAQEPVTDTGNAAGKLPLTPRERDVLAGVAQGWSNKEVGRALGLQEVTVKLHVRSICRKLGVRNRTEAALKAVSLGLERSGAQL